MDRVKGQWYVKGVYGNKADKKIAIAKEREI